MGNTFRNEKTFSRKADRQTTLATSRIRSKAIKNQYQRETWQESYEAHGNDYNDTHDVGGADHD